MGQVARRPTGESRTEHRLRSLQPAPQSEGESTSTPPEPRSAMGHLFWQNLLHETLESELAPLRAAIERLEATQAREPRSAPTEQLMAQIGELRGRTESLAKSLESQVQAQARRQDHLQDVVTRRLLIQTQVQERLFGQLQQDQRSTARAVHELADAHAALLDHLEASLEASQGHLLAMQNRTRRLQFAFALMMVVVTLGLITAVVFLRFAPA